MSDLKPCPHCGEAEELYRGMRDMGRSGPFSIDCLGCGADFVPREGTDVVAAWNRRDESALSQARADGRRKGLEEARFLVNRLYWFERDLCGGDSDGLYREWCGHVSPALERFTNVLGLAQKEGKDGPHR